MSQKGMRGNRYLTDEEMANKPKVTKELLMRIASYLLPYTKQMFGAKFDCNIIYL